MDEIQSEEQNNDNVQRNKIDKKRNLYCFNYMDLTIWLVVSSISAVSVTVDSYNQDVIVGITGFDFSLTLITTLLAVIGIKQDLLLFTIPWMLISLWSMVTCQYFSLEEIGTRIIKSNYTGPLTGPIVLTAIILALAFRMMIWGKIFYHTFLNKQPEHKTKTKQNKGNDEQQNTNIKNN